MAQSVQKIIDKKDRTIVDSENQLLDGFDGIEKDIYNSVLKKVRTFDQKDGKIIFDDDTVTGINEINGIVAKSIQNSKYVGKVRDYLRDFETIKQFNFDIHQDVNDLSPDELSDLINPVQRQIVNQTLQNLTGQGVNTNFIDPLREGIFKNIVAGTTITDLEGYLNAFINTNPERMGQFKRYVSQVSRDALNQFDGQVNSRIAEEFGLDAFRYVGSIIEDSRPQCVRWVGLGVITAENLSNELSWAYSNGTGMIPGTTVDNFAVYRGGYNCRHSAIPFKLTKSQKRELEGGGEIPPDETPIPEQKVTLTPEQKTVQPLSQAQKDLNLTFGESPLVPKVLKGMNIPDQVFILSDNGKTNKTLFGDSYYRDDNKTVYLGIEGTRSKQSKYYQKSVIIHEFAHRTHFEKNIFVEEMFDFKDKNGKFKLPERTENQKLHLKYFDESNKIFQKKYPIEKWSDNKTRNDFNLDILFEKYKNKFDGFNESDIKEMISAYSDTIASFTKGDVGFGHAIDYWKKNSGSKRPMEWFAHASENYWFGNPVFEAEFPELYNQMMEYYKNEVVDVYLKDYLK